MGTDIYLKWDKQTNDEQKAQITGWSIDAGQHGYLRASIGMIEENTALRLLFPAKFWKGYKAYSYNFSENIPLMYKVLRAYINGKMQPSVLADEEVINRQSAANTALIGFMSQMGCTLKNDDFTDDHRLMWARSVARFFLLGKKRQEEGKKPKVYISW